MIARISEHFFLGPPSIYSPKGALSLTPPLWDRENGKSFIETLVLNMLNLLLGQS